MDDAFSGNNSAAFPGSPIADRFFRAQAPALERPPRLRSREKRLMMFVGRPCGRNLGTTAVDYVQSFLKPETSVTATGKVEFRNNNNMTLFSLLI